MAVYNDMQLIKREFFSRRNGVIVDTLRKAGVPYRIIFGLTLPQIREIAGAAGKNRDLAVRLWENRTTRESAMLAPYLFDAETLTEREAAELLAQSPAPEITDILCMALLRRHKDAFSIADEALENGNEYGAMRLFINMLQIGAVKDKDEMNRWLGFAKKVIETGDKAAKGVAMQVVEEIQFNLES